jgi:hypothetical protein
MILDLQAVFEFDDATDEDFLEILNFHLARFKEALACKQLYWYFFENDLGDGSINRERLQRYDKLYNSYKDQFKTLKSDSGKMDKYIAFIKR